MKKLEVLKAIAIVALFFICACTKSAKQKGIDLGKEFCEVADKYKDFKMGETNLEKLAEFQKESMALIDKQKKIQSELPMGEIQEFLIAYGIEIQKCNSFNKENIKEIQEVQISDDQKLHDSIEKAVRFKDSIESIQYEQSQQNNLYAQDDMFSDAQDYLGKYSAEFGNSKIVIVIGEISHDGDIITAYNVFKGKKTFMTGTYNGIMLGDKSNSFTFNLLEPKGSSNGKFSLFFSKMTPHGTWESYNGKLKREFELRQEN